MAGSLDYGIKRQALHCHRLAFIDPFTKKEMVHASSLTDDFETVIMNLQTKKD
jgi:23S rRNA pseudouridine1911/1915/1917 synthase